MTVKSTADDEVWLWVARIPNLNCHSFQHDFNLSLTTSEHAFAGCCGIRRQCQVFGEPVLVAWLPLLVDALEGYSSDVINFYHFSAHLIDSIVSRPTSLERPVLHQVQRQWKVNPSKLDTQWNDYFRALEAIRVETAGDNRWQLPRVVISCDFGYQSVISSQVDSIRYSCRFLGLKMHDCMLTFPKSMLLRCIPMTCCRCSS